MPAISETFQCKHDAEQRNRLLLMFFYVQHIALSSLDLQIISRLEKLLLQSLVTLVRSNVELGEPLFPLKVVMKV